MSYTHLTDQERYWLGHQNMADWSLSRMSESIGRCKGTLSRELRCNECPCYESYDSYLAGGMASRWLAASDPGGFSAVLTG